MSGVDSGGVAGEQISNRYFQLQSASRLVLFAGRLILAHNEILYPYHKWLMVTVANAPKKPAELTGLLNVLLDEPTWQNAEQVRLSLDRYLDLEKYASTYISRFVMDSEWNWLSGSPPVEDW